LLGKHLIYDENWSSKMVVAKEPSKLL